MWIKISIFVLAAAIVLLLLKIYFEGKERRNAKNFSDEFNNLTTSQLKERFETLKQLKFNISNDFIKSSTEEQQKKIERLKNIDNKIERLCDILAERGEFDFMKSNNLNPQSKINYVI